MIVREDVVLVLEYLREKKYSLALRQLELILDADKEDEEERKE